MKLSYLITTPFLSVLVGFATGVVLTLQLLSYRQTRITVATASTTTVFSTFSQNTQSKNCSSTKLTIDHGNIAQFYEEFYKYYELNKEWLKKSFLGVHFLQNPNDAITIAEILHDQDVDLVIETGTYRGGAALFFASVMYQYRYNARQKTIRPFKVVTMDVSPQAKIYIDRYPLLADYITFIPHSSVSKAAKDLVNLTYNEIKPTNVFISLDGDHYAQAVYDELVYYHKYVSNVGNYILVQDTRLSRKWHTVYCVEAKFDGHCNGPQEGANWFLQNEGQRYFNIDPGKEYLFSTHHRGWLKRVAHRHYIFFKVLIFSACSAGLLCTQT